MRKFATIYLVPFIGTIDALPSSGRGAQQADESAREGQTEAERKRTAKTTPAASLTI